MSFLFKLRFDSFDITRVLHETSILVHHMYSRPQQFAPMPAPRLVVKVLCSAVVSFVPVS